MGAAGSVKSFADTVKDDHEPHFQASSSSSASPSNTNTTKLGSNSTHSHTITSPKYNDQYSKNLRIDNSGWASHNKFESKNIQGDDSAGIDLDDLDLNLNLADEVDDQDTIDIGFVNEPDEDCFETKHLASKSSAVDATKTPLPNSQASDSSFSHKKLGLHLNGVFSVVGLKNGEMVSSGADRVLRFYKKLSTGSMRIEKRPDLSQENVDAECIMAVKLDAEVVTIAEIPVLSDFAFVATGMSDCSIRIWSNKTSNERERWACTASLVGHTQSVLCLAAYPHAPKETKSSVLSNTVAQTISWATSFPATKSSGTEPSAAAAVDGVMIISGSADHTVRLWGMVLGSPTAAASASPPSTTSWVCFRVLRGHRGSVTSVLAMDCNSGRMLRKKQRVVSGSDDGMMMIWDILSGDVLHKLSNHSAAINSMALRYQVGSPSHKDGSVLEFVVSASSDGKLLLWNVFTEKFEAELKGHEHAVLSVIVLADGRIVSGAVDGAIREWACYGGYGRTSSGNQWLWSCKGKLNAHSGAVKALSPLPSSSRGGARFLSGSADGQILWWESSGQN